MKRPKDFYLLLLEYALVAIRATDDEKRGRVARLLSDTFHNVPGALCLDWTAERDAGVYRYIRSNAEMYGLSEILDGSSRDTLLNCCLHALELPATSPKANPGRSRKRGELSKVSLKLPSLTLKRLRRRRRKTVQSPELRRIRKLWGHLT